VLQQALNNASIIRLSGIIPETLNRTRRIIMKENLIRYSMQIAMLGQLLALTLIIEKEFSLIKNRLMQDYGVLSDLTS